MITLAITHERDDRRPGGWFVVRCPELGRLVDHGDGAVRRSTRIDALRAARAAVLERELAHVRAGGAPTVFFHVITDQTASAARAGEGATP